MRSVEEVVEHLLVAVVSDRLRGRKVPSYKAYANLQGEPVVIRLQTNVPGEVWLRCTFPLRRDKWGDAVSRDSASFRPDAEQLHAVLTTLVDGVNPNRRNP